MKTGMTEERHVILLLGRRVVPEAVDMPEAQPLGCPAEQPARDPAPAVEPPRRRACRYPPGLLPHDPSCVADAGIDLKVTECLICVHDLQVGVGATGRFSLLAGGLPGPDSLLIVRSLSRVLWMVLALLTLGEPLLSSKTCCAPPSRTRRSQTSSVASWLE